MKFSIRDLLLVTVIVALAVGWFCHWSVQEHRYKRRGEYVERLKDSLRRTIYQRDHLADILKREERGYIFSNSSGKLPAELETEPRD